MNLAISRRDLLSSALAAAVALPLSRAALAADAFRRVKVGVIGTTHAHAAGKLETVRRLADLFDVVGVVEPDEGRRRRLAGRREYADVPLLSEEQLLNHPGLEAVLVETQVKELVPTAVRVVAAGFHLHVDKPAGASLPAFAKLLESAKAKSRILQMGYMLRGSPAFQFCFRAAREGWLGDVYEVHGVMGKVLGAAERTAIASFPGGIMFELGCHLIDATVAILGKPQDVKPYLRQTRPQKDNLADNTLAVLEYPKALATIRCAAVDVEGNARRQFSVCGDAGAITLLPMESPKLTLTLTAAHGDQAAGTRVIEFKKVPRYDGQLIDLAHAIRGEKAPGYTPEHDLAVQEAILKASGMPTD